MNHTLIRILLIPLFITISAQENPKNFHLFSQIESRFVSARDIIIRLPESYTPEKQYPVLYMHDGQMLFSHQQTWNGQNWGVGQTLRRLEKNHTVPETIVVGVANISAERHAHYFPEKPFLSLPQTIQDSLYSLKRGENPLFGKPVQADNYLKFLVYELKPFIDANFATKKERNATFIAGSSMGGLISMYAFFEYPEIFGGAACLSTHWIGAFENNDVIPKAFENYLEQRKLLIAERKLYFDTGTETLDAHYGNHQKEVDRIFNDIKKVDYQYLSLVFEGAAHTENDWKARLESPLVFLLKDLN